jgi:hypothetical protein
MCHGGKEKSDAVSFSRNSSLLITKQTRVLSLEIHPRPGHKWELFTLERVDATRCLTEEMFDQEFLIAADIDHAGHH